MLYHLCLTFMIPGIRLNSSMASAEHVLRSASTAYTATALLTRCVVLPVFVCYRWPTVCIRCVNSSYIHLRDASSCTYTCVAVRCHLLPVLRLPFSIRLMPASTGDWPCMIPRTTRDSSWASSAAILLPPCTYETSHAKVLPYSYGTSNTATLAEHKPAPVTCLCESV